MTLCPFYNHLGHIYKDRNTKKCQHISIWQVHFICLSYDVASERVITPCIKNDNSQWIKYMLLLNTCLDIHIKFSHYRPVILAVFLQIEKASSRDCAKIPHYMDFWHCIFFIGWKCTHSVRPAVRSWRRTIITEKFNAIRFRQVTETKKISNDQELIQSDPTWRKSVIVSLVHFFSFPTTRLMQIFCFFPVWICMPQFSSINCRKWKEKSQNEIKIITHYSIRRFLPVSYIYHSDIRYAKTNHCQCKQNWISPR